VVLFVSLIANVLLAFFLVADWATVFDTERSALKERVIIGDPNATDKVAVIRIEGVIYDTTIVYPIQQLERAAKDKRVKAVVLRIDSPGGSVSASEELYQNVVNLRDDNGRRFQGTGPKPVSVSMGGVCASGGYYIAAAGKPISAEVTTITGSIGVFAALPNVAKLAHDNGVKVELVKAGGIKASGSFFHDMTPEERQTWQDTVDSAYEVFLERVAAGRPLTKEQLRADPVIKTTILERDEKGNIKTRDGKEIQVPYTRVRADGGTFTATQARQFELIDSIADLPAAARTAAAAAGLSEYKVVVYDRPPTMLEMLVGTEIRTRHDVFDLRDLGSALTPRLWYLTPSADGAILTATR
jgi:protease-4